MPNLIKPHLEIISLKISVYKFMLGTYLHTHTTAYIAYAPICSDINTHANKIPTQNTFIHTHTHTYTHTHTSSQSRTFYLGFYTRSRVKI